MKGLEHLTLLIERNPNHKPVTRVPFYELAVLEALHNMEDGGDEGIFVTQVGNPELVPLVDENGDSIEFDPVEAYNALLRKYQSKEGMKALKTAYPNARALERAVGELPNMPTAKNVAKPVQKKTRKQKEPAQAAA